MGERRIVQDVLGVHVGTTNPDGAELRRLVANRERVAALLRASHRAVTPASAGAYRSSYAAKLWALGETAAPSELRAGRRQAAPHLSVVGSALLEPDDDER